MMLCERKSRKESTTKCVRECKEGACFQKCGARCTARRTTKKEPANKLRIQVSQRDQCQHDRKEKPTRRLRRKTQCVEQEPTQKLRIEGNRCQHDRKETPTRRLRRKTQCVERRQAGCAENARDRNRKCSQCLEEATRRKSESEPELVNTVGSRHTENEKHMHTCRHRQPAPERHDQTYQT